jgi:predicted short-subunit dehydrogenase-like oxidoreductase (DUF2520 family)
MSDITLIGTGKLGTSLGFALSLKGSRIVALSDRNLSSAKESRQIIGEGKVFKENASAARLGDWIILTVPDDEIEKVAGELADSDIEWKGKYVFHCSGLHSTESLISLKKKGARVASLHPVRSFARKKTAPDAFEDIFFGLEGKAEALKAAKEIVLQLGGRYFILRPEDKPLYHTACSMASNFLVTILDTAVYLLQQAGLTKSVASQILFPLVQGTLQNVKKFNAGSALTGPIVRGDKVSVQKQLKALEKFPEVLKLYKKLASQTLCFARREKNLSEADFKTLKALLEEK